MERASRLAPDAGLDEQTLWASLALARRERMPIELFKPAVERTAGPYAARLWALIERPASFDDPAALEKQLAGLPLELQGQVYVMGLVLRRKSAPKAWRDMARALLFASERPYFEE